MSRIISFLAKIQDFKGDSPPQNLINKESGSVIIWIFIMVVLFAALNFVMTQGTRSGEEQLSDQQADLAATEILDYASAIKRAVQELQINGCSDTEISFENSTVAGYENPNAPNDNSCHVFQPNGGGLQYLIPNRDWLDENFSSNSTYGEWGWGASYNIEGNGTTATDLRIVLNALDKNLCIAINDKLNISNPSGNPPIDTNTGGSTNFIGSYAATPANNVGDDGGHDLPGKAAFCRQGNASLLQFNQVLIAR